MTSKVWPIAATTYKELIRSRVLYSVIFFGAVLILVSAFFGSVTIGDQTKVIKDFGLFSISIFCAAFSVLAGASILFKELSRRTIYNILAKAVERSEFVVGKFFGMFLTALSMLVIMAAGLTAFTAIFSGKFEAGLLVAYVHIAFELSIVCALAIFFSSITVTPSLSGLFTFFIFLAGRSRGHLLYFVNSDSSNFLLKRLLNGLYLALPPLDVINISNLVVYDRGLSLEQSLLSGIYTISYCVILLIIASLVFERRQFN